MLVDSSDVKCLHFTIMANPNVQQNLLYRQAADRAVEHLMSLIRRRGYNDVTKDTHRVYTKKAGEYAEVEISPYFGSGYSFHSKASGLKCLVRCHHKTLVFRCHSEDYLQLNWNKILTRHLDELERRIAAKAALNEKEDNRRRNLALANKELALPHSKDFPETGYFPGFRRTRQNDGTYDVHISHTVTLDQARRLLSILKEGHP